MIELEGFVELDRRFRRLKNNLAQEASALGTYLYDPLDRLIGRETNSNQTPPRQAFVFDGNQIVLQFAGSSSAALEAQDLATRYLWGPSVDMLLAREQVSTDTYQTYQESPPPETVEWMLLDGQNTVRDEVIYDFTNSSVSYVHVNDDSYGNDLDGSGDFNPIAWTGRFHDWQTGLQWNGSTQGGGRWYNPSLGRWMSEDSIGFAGGTTCLYCYCGNSPTNEVDPSGLQSPGYGALPNPRFELPPNPPIVPGGDPNNNCYNYACDRMFPTGPKFWQVGSTIGFGSSPNSCKALTERVKKERGAVDPDYWTGKCPKGYHRIRLWLLPGNDYHFYRQDPNADNLLVGWSDKPGTCQVRKNLPNPWEYEPGYQNCGDLCVPD